MSAPNKEHVRVPCRQLSNAVRVSDLEQSLQDLRDAMEELQADIEEHEEAIQTAQAAGSTIGTATKGCPWPKTLEKTISDLREMREIMAEFRSDIESRVEAHELAKAKAKLCEAGRQNS